MPPLRSLRAASLLALISSVPAFGAAYVGSAYEGFDYAAGNLTNAFIGGTGWNATGDAGDPTNTTWGVSPAGTIFNPGTTAGNQTVTASTLDYAAVIDYPAPVGGAALITGAGQIGRSFGQDVDSGTFYFSFLAQKTIDQVRTVNLSLFAAAASGGERIAIGQIANNVNLRLPDGTPDPDATTKANQGQIVVLISSPQTDSTAAAGVYTAVQPASFAVGQTLLIVGKIEFNVAGTNGSLDRLTLFLNPSSFDNEGALTPYIVVNGVNFGTLSGLRMFAGGSQTVVTPPATFSPSAAMFDEIRLGSTFAAVTTGVSAPASPLQEWLDLHFTVLEQADLAVGALAADPDGDGRSNLLEYALDSAPRAADVTPGPVAYSTSGGLALDYPALRTDVTYVVETSADLAVWTTVGVTDAPTGGGAPAHMRTATVSLPGGSGRVFLRLRVTRIE